MGLAQSCNWKWRINAECFVKDGVEALRIRVYTLDLIGVAKQGKHCVKNEIRSGFMSGDQQQRHG